MMLTALCTILMIQTVSAVQELTDNDFYNYAAKKEVLLVDFYAPWCSDCTRLAPQYEAAATALGPRSTDLVKVDCFGAGKGLCEMYGVRSWPQLKSFHHGTYNGDYNGPQTATDIANYINTVENSAAPQAAPEQPVGNPYANAQPATQYAASQPVATTVACGKCKIEKPKGKIAKGCTAALKKACITGANKKLTRAQQKYGSDDK